MTKMCLQAESSSGGSGLSSALDKVAEKVRKRKQEQQDRIEATHTKREVELAHSSYLRQSISSPDVTADAKYAITSWNRTNVRGLGIPKQYETCRKVNVSKAMLNTSSKRAAASTKLTSGIKICPVLQCQMKFADQYLLQHHMNKYYHNPCSPLLHLENGQLDKDVLTTHICPMCTVIYSDYGSCMEHMKARGHDILMDALRVAGYMCPECLLVYPDRSSCDIHMAERNHHYLAYPFADDNRQEGKPVPIPSNTLDLFLMQCKSSEWKLHCLDCESSTKDTEIEQHLQKKHTLRANSEDTPADIFGLLLKPFSCAQCLRLFDVLPDAGLCSLHKCSDSVTGMYIMSDFRTFQEFVCRLGLNPINFDTFDATPDIVGGEHVVHDQDMLGPIQRGLWRDSVEADNNSSVTEGSESSPNISEISFQHKRKYNDSPCNLSTDSVDSKLNKLVVQSQSSESDMHGSPIPGTSTADVNANYKSSSDLSGISKEQFNDVKEIFGRSPPLKRARFAEAYDRNADKCLELSNKTDNFMDAITIEDGGVDYTKTKRDTHDTPTSLLPSGSNMTTTSSDIRIPHGVDSSLLTNSQTDPSDRNTTSERDTHDTSSDNKISQGRDSSLVTNSRIPVFTTECHSNTWSAPVAQETLASMKQIIFLDMDNWPNFFKRLPGPLPLHTFVWGFIGGSTVWRPPKNCPMFDICCDNNSFNIHRRSGKTKNAADFALCMMAGRMDAVLPKHIPFTILSGDKGFIELQNQMEDSERRAVVINPHHKTPEEVYVMIESVAEI